VTGGVCAAGLPDGRVGLGVLAALHDQYADNRLYASLAAIDIRLPNVDDDLADL